MKTNLHTLIVPPEMDVYGRQTDRLVNLSRHEHVIAAIQHT